MQDLQFSIDIHAPTEKVWQTLWQDQSFRQWASIIDPETYMVGELKEGSQVQFISSHGGYGVTSLVEKVIPNQFLLLKHQADTQDEGEHEREEQWTGGQETYQLKEINDTTTLTVIFSVPPELEQYFKDTYPKALNCIKELAESAA